MSIATLSLWRNEAMCQFWPAGRRSWCHGPSDHSSYVVSWALDWRICRVFSSWWSGTILYPRSCSTDSFRLPLCSQRKLVQGQNVLERPSRPCARTRRGTSVRRWTSLRTGERGLKHSKWHSIASHHISDRTLSIFHCCFCRMSCSV